MMAISCAGNRRGEFKEIQRTIPGHGFHQNAIGNVVFTGVPLVDILKEMGFNLEHLKDKHLIAESLDSDPVGNCFQISIPMSRVIDPRNEVMIAYELNGVDLP
jgi:sulfite oxidase